MAATHSSNPPDRISGFHADVHNASLAELIQLECLSGQRAAFEVSSGNQKGLLFFAKGQVFDARFGAYRGIKAIEKMLQLRGGDFRQVDVNWSPRGTIDQPWESLLLKAAYAHDEAQMPASGVRGEVVEFPRAAPNLTASSTDQPDETDEFDAEFFIDMDDDRPTPVDSVASVEINADGQIEAARGDSGKLLDAAAYVLSIGDLIGNTLALGRVLSAEATTETECFCVTRHERGGAQAMRGPSQQVQNILQRERRP